MIYHHTDEDIRAYFSEDALNQSSIKAILENGMQSYLDQQYFLRRQEKEYGEKKHNVIGTAVDCKLTHMPESFLNTHHISTLVKKPGKSGLAVLRCAFDKVLEKFPETQIIELPYYKKEVYEACNEEQYYMNRDKGPDNNDSRMGSLVKDNGEAYWQDMINAGGKQVLVDSEVQIIETVEKNFLEHSHTSWIFQDAPNVDIVYQFPMYFTIKKTYCKAMPDIIRVEHDKKLIRIIDAKTIGRFITLFNKQVRELRYDIQASFYYHAVLACLKQLATLIGKQLNDYKVVFAFAAESTVKPGVPLVFPISNTLLEHGKQGGNYLKGWMHGIYLFETWAENAFELEQMVTESNGVVWIDTDFTYSQIF